MPRIVRPMKVDPDHLPRVGCASNCLGVRVPPNKNADIDLDSGGNVILNGKGMSVSDDWRKLSGHLIPEGLDDGQNNARGKGMRVFVHGSGRFEDGTVTSKLMLHLKVGSQSNGVVSPVEAVDLALFQASLAETRSDWLIDEG